MSLNSKKSWHPAKAINRARVQKQKEDADSRRRHEESRLEELEHERQALRLEPHIPGASDKLAWIYDTKQDALPAPPQDTSEGVSRTAREDNSSYTSLYSLGMVHGSTPTKESARKKAADPLEEMVRRTRERIRHRKHSPLSKSASRISKPPSRGEIARS